MGGGGGGELLLYPMENTIIHIQWRTFFLPPRNKHFTHYHEFDIFKRTGNCNLAICDDERASSDGMQMPH